MPSSSVAVRELPLFPLPEVVLFPGRPLPLYIFEFRYRIMMNTILESDSRFGVMMWDSTQDRVVATGCCARIEDYQRLPDDRMKILTIGEKRFRVLDTVREKPYLVGLVEWIEDAPSEKELRELATKVDLLLKDVVHLSGKLMDQRIELPEDIPNLPKELSYWVASNLYGVATEQQALLEMQDTGARLEREVEILTSTRNHLAARTVLKDTLN
ncbi:MAG: LON peptidase substrate-binding domain-containing protein [Trichodesmium sp. St16_bin4-tuft]|nr:LON peptidase substrate-binding domain-containing protein [Trichodesmium sp. MAG_R01]MDE5071759.1 LON peptidase substrate-binding domain-containing protein [Trichodesmium sp. St5_bin8]MDE5077661.1 LON peptidase substrate-binding domain-containing protein [Trichodesmium sp. St2_bin6]MDE5097500.1 LON peptidase substrate-binding domain-containing protein [Trichodesmium sp. St16_bin4-tuft]MDE5105066.1 LON peptidase substrate-binding domain-containing protein [Trichodesmium sp. St19_bin2]